MFLLVISAASGALGLLWDFDVKLGWPRKRLVRCLLMLAMLSLVVAVGLATILLFEAAHIMKGMVP